MGIGEVVFIDHLLGDVPAMDAHVLVDKHVGDQEKIFEIAGAVPGTEMSVGDDTVDMKFKIDESDGGGADILISVEAVATNGHAETVDFRFAGTHGTNEVGVRDFAAMRDLVGQDENHGVVASNLFTDRAGFAETLGAATPFIGERSGPDSGVKTSEERINVFNLTSVGVVHFASDSGVVLDRLREQGSLVSAGIETETRGQSSARAFAEKGDGRRHDWCGRLGDLHPRKWYRDHLWG